MSDPADAILERMAVVGLDEIERIAALDTRNDRKYVVGPAGATALLAGLSEQVAVLEIEGRRRFRYRSVYYDTPGLDCFRAAAHRRRRRAKVRTRSYLDSATATVEVKVRGGRGETVKSRLPVPGGNPRLVYPAAYRFVEEALGGLVPVESLAPALVVTYLRATLLDREMGHRVTIDCDVMWESPGGHTAGLPGLVVVETKSPGGTGPADRLLWQAGHRPVPLSKYGVGMAMLHPDLPANRWNRVLQTLRQPVG